MTAQEGGVEPESDDGPLLTMLTSMAPDDIGFALATAVKTPNRGDQAATP